ncbi:MULTISPECIES: hypothetical protein [Avibacterium]|uniref:Uncharacterized protein n=1 Tax=Avibacterium volantium TaxID=762 RepID=A0A3S4HK05_AVIVO|nr:hypothetical protein [Avibacterium volantium]VEB24652.1 Uncharacterised protein [Avibacterium volantium]
MGTLAANQFLGESYGFWIQTGAIILSILVTGYYARKAILSNGRSAKETLNHNQEGAVLDN